MEDLLILEYPKDGVRLYDNRIEYSDRGLRTALAITHVTDLALGHKRVGVWVGVRWHWITLCRKDDAEELFTAASLLIGR
ncbi:MAG: hypothetical protein SOY67_06840 [Collinsella sp.]|nr:hypothetical protein [Collinsella sp.]